MPKVTFFKGAVMRLATIVVVVAVRIFVVTQVSLFKKAVMRLTTIVLVVAVSVSVVPQLKCRHRHSALSSLLTIAFSTKLIVFFSSPVLLV